MLRKKKKNMNDDVLPRSSATLRQSQQAVIDDVGVEHADDADDGVVVVGVDGDDESALSPAARPRCRAVQRLELCRGVGSSQRPPPP